MGVDHMIVLETEKLTLLRIRIRDLSRALAAFLAMGFLCLRSMRCGWCCEELVLAMCLDCERWRAVFPVQDDLRNCWKTFSLERIISTVSSSGIKIGMPACAGPSARFWGQNDARGKHTPAVQNRRRRRGEENERKRGSQTGEQRRCCSSDRRKRSPFKSHVGTSCVM